jgi:hypothetical protein
MTAKADEDLVAHYRAKAEKCRELAAKGATQLHRDQWLKYADEWIKLAETAQRPR